MMDFSSWMGCVLCSQSENTEDAEYVDTYSTMDTLCCRKAPAEFDRGDRIIIVDESEQQQQQRRRPKTLQKRVSWADHASGRLEIVKDVEDDGTEPSRATLRLLVVALLVEELTLGAMARLLSPLGAAEAAAIAWLRERYALPDFLGDEWAPRSVLDEEQLGELVRSVCSTLGATDAKVRTLAAARLADKTIKDLSRALAAELFVPTSRSSSPARARLAASDEALEISARLSAAVGDAAKRPPPPPDACPAKILDSKLLARVVADILEPSPDPVVRLLAIEFAKTPLGRTFSAWRPHAANPDALDAFPDKAHLATGTPAVFFNENWVPSTLLDDVSVLKIVVDLCSDARLDVPAALAATLEFHSLADIADLAAPVFGRDHSALADALADRVAEEADLPPGFVNPNLKPLDVLQQHAFENVIARVLLLDPHHGGGGRGGGREIVDDHPA